MDVLLKWEADSFTFGFYGIISVCISLSCLLSVSTFRIDALELVKVLAMDFHVDPVPTVWTQPCGTLTMLCWEPLMFTALAFIFLDFARFDGSALFCMFIQNLLIMNLWLLNRWKRIWKRSGSSKLPGNLLPDRIRLLFWWFPRQDLDG